MIDLCAGLGGWQAPFNDNGWQTVGVDIQRMDGVDVQADVRQLPLDCSPTLVTASPPCEAFSTAWNRWTPLSERDPDTSVWDGCLRAIQQLNPRWWILENVAGAQHWFGPADKSCYPWMLWGDFPPFDAPDLRSKGETWNQDPSETAKIPYRLADSLRQSIEWYL
jgi:site-specific DNA-cytosine methylase